MEFHSTLNRSGEAHLGGNDVVRRVDLLKLLSGAGIDRDTFGSVWRGS